MDFHFEDPKYLEIDQIIDFLYDLKEVKQRNWRTIKIYVAGLRWYYQHILDDVETAASIPYPKEEKTLPRIISREDLTLPSELRGLFLQNQSLLYKLLFHCAWDTIDEFALNPRQRMMAKAGMIAILHTWTQKLLYHPHVHCIVPAGGIDKSGQWKTSKGKDDFLFYVPAVANKFRGKFMHHLNRLYNAKQLKATGKQAMLLNPKVWQELKSKLYKTKWVVNCKEPFRGPDTVLEYLGRYTHKIAISNYRIKEITDTMVGFTYLDRADGNKQKYLELSGVKFIRRFLFHIVPYRFIRIRHYGFLSTRVKKKQLKEIREVLQHPDPGVKPKLTVREVIKIVYGHDIDVCQSCKEGVLLVVEKWTKDRASPIDIGVIKTTV